MNDGLTANNRNDLIRVFELFPEIDEVILYGSRAKGNFQTYSDIDITLKGKKLNLLLMSKITLLIDDLPIPYKFDVSAYHQISNDELLDHIHRVGKVIYNSKSDKIIYQV